MRLWACRLAVALACVLVSPVLATPARAEAPAPAATSAGSLAAQPDASVGAELAEITARAAAAKRGEAIFRATGGCSCHTNYPGEGEAAPELAGGRPLETPFGIFYSTNITPDPETGIGRWSDADFVRAMREGLSPEGEHYFPVFPYPAFAGLRHEDLVDMRAYLETLAPVERPNKPPGAPFPFSWRATVAGWKLMNFDPAPIEPDAKQSAEWNRGRYLALAAAHCGECHTPRTLTGGLDRSLWLAGSRDGPEGELAPNITPDSRTGIGDWSVNDLVWYLEMGIKPDGDDTQGLMSEVIEHGYTHLAPDELRAIAVYLKSVPAIENEVRGE